MALPGTYKGTRDPYSEEGISTYPSNMFEHFESDSNVDATLDTFAGLLVLPSSLLPKFMSQESMSPFRGAIEELHKEVQFCMWAMNISLSVYMKLLTLVDISIRREISDTISQYLAEWKGEQDTVLFDSLDELIISEFTKHSVTEIPDMELLQRSQESQVLSSTVACYIKDIALNLDSMRQSNLEETIEIIFPSSKNFIGRCFFPRLATVSAKLLELINQSLDLSAKSGVLRDCSQLSSNSTFVSSR